MEKEQKITLIRIIISGLLLALYMMVSIDNKYAALGAALVPFIIIGYDVIFKAFRNIFRGEIFDEHFLMAIASLGCFASGFLSGSGDYAEGTAVMLFYQIGELCQDMAVDSSRRSIEALMDIRPDTANLRLPDGSTKTVHPDEVPAGSIIMVKPGERIPLDGVITEGSTSIDTSSLTGESMPRDAEEGAEVLSGCINLNGMILIKTTRTFGESTVSKVLDLVQNSAEKRSKTENFLSRFAKIYTPVVVISAVLLALIPSIITGDVYNWVNRALIFLVISCPCALVISVPLSFFGGIGGASRAGILIKGSNYLEALSKTDTVVFDKTGTLTKGIFAVTAVHPKEISEAQLLEYAAYAESYSTHPIASSIVTEYGCNVDRDRISDYREISGRGISCKVSGKTVLAGNDKLMADNGIEWKSCHHTGTIVHVAIDGEYAGHIIISDEIKPDSADTIRKLKAAGIKTVMLTGDSKRVGEGIGSALGLDEVYCELLPADKVSIVERLINECGGRLSFVGDGINDAPVIARADVGVAMGAGSDAAIEAADIVLMDDKPSKAAAAIKIAKRTMGIARQNIVFALGVKIAILVLGALGIANMWLAVFADVGVAIIAVLNAMRSMSVKKLI